MSDNRYWRIFKQAFDIVSKNKRTLLRLARASKPKPQVVPPPPPESKDETPLPVAPLPETFPASNMDFVRLVIEPSGRPRTETFNRFGMARLPGLGCVAALTHYFEQGLLNRDGWERLARDFYRWQRHNP